MTSKGHRRLRKYKKCKPKVKSVGRMPPEQFEILKAAEESEHEIIARLVGKVTRKRPR